MEPVVLKVCINDGPIVTVDKIKVIVENVYFDDPDSTKDSQDDEYDGQLCTTFTDEGVIVDLVENDVVIATTCHDHNDAAQNTLERGMGQSNSSY